MSKIKRKLMAHFIDASMTDTPNYERLGTELEEFTVEMNANVETTTNILGETTTSIDSYQPQASADPYVADTDSALYTRLQTIIDERLTLDDLKATIVEVHLWEETSTEGVYTAYREDVVIEVSSYGGDNTGYQIPFNVYHTGNRVAGTFELSTKTFTAATDSTTTTTTESTTTTTTES